MKLVADAGQADGTNSGSVGVAVAVNIVLFTTEAYLTHNVTLNATEVTVEALKGANRSEYDLSTESGATGGGGASFAGSLVVNVVVLNSAAEIRPTGSVVVNGNMTVTATTDVLDKAVAKSHVDGGGNSVGAGAAVAVNVVNLATSASLPSGAALAGVHHLNLSATTHSNSQTRAEGGADDGGSLTLTAVGALNIDNVATTADVGSGPDLTVGGQLTAHADQDATSETIGKGATTGAGNLAIGATIALTFADHETDASLARNATADGSVDFEADSYSETDTEATASAVGAKSQGGGAGQDSTNVNDKGDKQASFGKSTSTSNGGKGSKDSTPKTKQ